MRVLIYIPQLRDFGYAVGHQRFPRTQKHLVPEDSKARTAWEVGVVLCLREGRMAMETKFQL